MGWREKPDDGLTDQERVAYNKILESKKATMEADARAEAKQVVKDYAGDQYFREFIEAMDKFSGNKDRLRETKEHYRKRGIPVDSIDIEKAVRDLRSERGS